MCLLGAVSTRMVALKTNIWPVWSPIQGKSSKKRIPNWRNLNVLQLWCPLSLRLPSCHTKKSKKKEKNKDNEQNMPEEPLENRHELQSGVENEKEISKKKRSKESRIQNQTISTRTKISPKKCQELRKGSVERLSYQILRRMLSWKILKKERKWNVSLAFTICQKISEILTSLQVLSRSVWTILLEMMSKLKEKYTCMLLYDCILQK